MSDLVETIRDDIVRALETDEMVLPTLPEVALQVREAVNDPEIDLGKLAGVLEKDTAITARIVKVANSPLLRASHPIENLHMAISRLGLDYTANLATSLAMQQMFQATSDVVDQRMRDTWTQSTEVAGIAHVLTRHYTKLKPDQATLAGIIHKIGVLPILTYAEDHRKLLRNPEALDLIIRKLHPGLGKMILKKWEFNEELQIVPMEHVNFKRKVDAVDYADVIMVANLQNLAGTDHPYTQFDWNKVSAFERLGLDPNVLTQDVEDLSEDMEAAMQLLQ